MEREVVAPAKILIRDESTEDRREMWAMVERAAARSLLTAPDGQVYVCAACGKWSKTLDGLRDSSCTTNAVLCYEGSVEIGDNGMVRRAKAAGAVQL